MSWAQKQHKLDTSVVCSRCLIEGSVRHLDYDLRCCWWTCKQHGAEITAEYIHHLSGAPEHP